MANLTPTPGWDNIPQLEAVTPALGGSGAPMNTQAQALLNRSEQLKTDLEALGDALDQIDNTADLDKPISTATQAALNLKAPLNSPTFTGTVMGIDKTMVGLGNVDNTADSAKPISNATQIALNLKAPLESPAFTGTVTGISKAMVGLSNVDNTTDASKPVSTPQQNALNLKANKAGDTFTGAVTATQFNGSGAGLTGTAGSLTAGNSSAVSGVSGWAYSNQNYNPPYLWATAGSSSSQFLVTPANLSVNYAGNAGNANTVGGGAPDRCGNWGFASGNLNNPYFRLDNGGNIKFMIVQTTNDNTVQALRQVGNPGYLEVTGSQGAFSTPLATSDIRLKTNVVPATVNASLVIKNLEMIEYDFLNGDHVKVGFSAQNLEAQDPSTVFDVEQPKDSPLAHLVAVKNLNTTQIIAYLAKSLQETLARLDAVESELAALSPK